MVDFVDIKTARDAANAQLTNYEAKLLTEFNPLRNRTLNRGLSSLTEVEKKRYDDLAAALEQVHHAMYLLAMITLQSINQSHEVRDIVNGLRGIADDVNQTAKKIQDIAGALQVAAEIAALVAAVAQKLAPLAGL